MKRARRFSRSSNRWTSLVVCLALVLSLLVISQPIGTSISFAQGNQQPRNDKARKVTPDAPRTGAPPFALPNLDEVEAATKRSGSATADSFGYPLKTQTARVAQRKASGRSRNNRNARHWSYSPKNRKR